MSDLLKDLRTSKAPASDVTEPASLETLILEDSARLLKEDERPEEIEEVAVSSRKNRRKKLKTSKVVNRAKQDPGKEEKRKAEQRRQDTNTRNIVNRQKERGKKPKGYADMYIPSPRNLIPQEDVTDSPAENRVEVLRPVLLGAVEYHPIWDGQETKSGALLKLKRAARRLKIDKQVPVNVGNPVFTEPAVTTALALYSKTNKAFYESLSPKNIGEFEDALAALGLIIEDGASASEVLYTLAFEYSKALKTGSARLDESSDREIESGTALIPTKDQKIERYASALKKNTTRCYDDLVDADDDDLEVSLKCLVTLLSKEIMLAYNAERTSTKLNTLWSETLFSTALDKKALSAPSDLEFFGSLSRKTANGVCFSNNISGRTTYNYPFEVSAIVSSTGTPVKSSFNYLDDLIMSNTIYYPGLDISGNVVKDTYTDPFSASASRYQYASDSIDELYDTATFGSADLYAVSFIKTILQRMSATAGVSALIPNLSNLLALQIMVEAAEDKNILDWLMIYLAFRQERYEGYSGAGDPPTGPSSIVRKSSRISSNLFKLNSAKKKSSNKVSPREISISPEPGESSGTKTFTSPERTSTITTEDDVASGDAGTLESVYGTTFEEICSTFIEKLMVKFRGNRVSFSQDTSKSKSISITSMESILSSTSLSMFEALLDYSSHISADLPDAGDKEAKVFVSKRSTVNSYNENAYSAAFVMTVCKLAKFLLSNKSTFTATSLVKAGSYARPAIGLTKTLSTAAPAVKGIGTSTTSEGEQATIKFSNDYGDKIREVSEFLASSEQDTSEIIESYPALASVIAGVAEEERFASSFCKSLTEFFVQARDKYIEVSNVLGLEAGGITLKDYLASGQSISSDVVKTMKSHSYSLNCSDMNYNGKKLNDKSTSKDGYRLLEDVLKYSGTTYLGQGKKNILCVGIPAGLLEKVKYEPAEIEDISGFSAENFDNSRFFIAIEKVDLADPDVKYRDMEFEFSRDLFCIGADPWSAYVKVDDDFVCKKLTRKEALEEFTAEVVSNHLVDSVMKQYMDLQHGMNFYETEFTNAKKEQSLSKKLLIPAASYLDTTSEPFLSASNLAYDPLSRSAKDFKFFDSDSVSLVDVNMEDVYEYSMFEYLTSYGNLFVSEAAQRNLESGLRFERVLCIPIDDNDFMLDFDDDLDDPQSSTETAEVQARLESQKEVGIGLETSQGVDMFTYRVSLRVGEEL